MFPYWDKEYAKRLVEIFQLDINKRINKLSKGMLSAVTIIIALASKAPMTFLDEPVAGLDVFMRERFYKLLVEEYTGTERTFVISTHIIDEAANVLEDVIIIEEGKIIRNENTEELLARHRLISGKDADIDEFCRKYKVLHSESLGRAKSVCVEINNPAEFENDIKNYDFDVSQASLQKLFTQLLDIKEV
jgi:ABC-2 type transport system ATP-binding protein